MAGAATLIAGCSGQNSASTRSLAPIPEALRSEMAAKNMPRNSPILVRAYKKESEIEVWKQTASGKFALLKSYPVCRWSGQLGPKKSEGDRQVPEGFYQVSQSQLNPNSRYYLSFDVGYPNNFDRQLGRAGGDIMVHGACSSRGCFAMTDKQMAEIYALAREALQAGQPAFQFQSFPFRMTAENMAKNRHNPNIGYWRNLKEGSDNFEVTKQAVKVDVCRGRYVFNGDNGAECGLKPASQELASAVRAKKRQDEIEIAAIVGSGVRPVSYIYADGGAHPTFSSRHVDSTAVPGKDRPFTRTEVTEVTLNDNGTPASEHDVATARRVTYTAAETLLMSEAAAARRPVKGPIDSRKVAARQQAVYARLVGSALPAMSQPDNVTVTASVPGRKADQALAMTQTSQPQTSQPQTGNDQSFYSGWFGSSAAQSSPDTMPVRTSSGSVEREKLQVRIGKPVVAAMSGTSQPETVATEQVAAAEKKPFYKRWLGLGGDSSAGQSQDY